METLASQAIGGSTHWRFLDVVIRVLIFLPGVHTLGCDQRGDAVRVVTRQESSKVYTWP